MSLVNQLKHLLRLHIPLGVYVLLITAILAPAIPFNYTVMVLLVLSYFLVNVLWRHYLKKRGELGDSGSGVLLLLIAWGVAAYQYYDAISPEPPQIVLYETSEPDVFSRSDDHPAPEATPESEAAEATRERLHRGRFSTFTGALHDKVRNLHDAGLACAFLKQQQQLNQCASDTFQESVRVELDNNATTIELFVAENAPERCMETACKLWLIQTTQQLIDEFTTIRIENQELGKPPPTASATLITQWEDVVTPVVVFNSESKGWRHVRVSDSLGNEVVWP